MNITILYSDNNPSDYHRLLLPAKYINDPAITIRLVKHTECCKDESVFHCDILFFSRLFIYDWATMVQLKKKYGFKIVVDFDDYYILSPHQLRYKMWQEHDVAARMIDACKGADMVFVTNEQLYNVYKEFNSTIVIVPNGLPFDQEPFVPRREPSGKLRFIYAAGATHYNDLKLLKGLFERLRSDGEFKRKATFAFCGYNNSIPECKKMESICKINGAYIRDQILPLKNYMDHYNHGDVSIAPLVDNFYNRCKSNLKFLEAAAMKLPFICSQVSPYSADMSLKNKGIIFCNNTAEWYKAFKFLMSTEKSTEDFGKLNYLAAKKMYDLNSINLIRVEAFH